MTTRLHPTSRLTFHPPVTLQPHRVRHSWRVLSSFEGPRGGLLWVSVCRRCGLQLDSQAGSRMRLPPCYAQQEIDWLGNAWMAQFLALNTLHRAPQEIRHADAA